MTAVSLVNCLSLVVLAAPAAEQAPWHLDGWRGRAVVRIEQPLAEPDVDTAAVRVLCQGRAKPDGSDYRVVDSVGGAVPFQLMFHDAGRYSLLAFRAAKPEPGAQFYVYFDNAQAPKAAEQVIAPETCGAGPPPGDWIPRHGLVLRTISRPEGDNPQTVEAMDSLIAGSKAGYGARYQRWISDGYNPFGPSDNYISIYRGWINIPAAGSYQFCTASNEASFSFLDGKPLVHWPGRHTARSGMRGEKNVSVELTAGPHYLEYYHEEVTLEQVAFLGWRPPGAREGQFLAVPESVYTAPHSAEAIRYESSTGPLVVFEPELVDSIWPSERHEGQYTRIRYRVGNPAAFPEGTTFRWDFGDGQKAEGLTAEHVYLKLGSYDVALSSEGSGGGAGARWPLGIFEIQHALEDVKQGRPPDYAKIAATYDMQQLEAESLKELAHLLSEAGMHAEAIRAGKIFVERFAAAHGELLPRVQRLMAASALQLGEEGTEQAIESFRASITDQTPPAEKFDSLAQLIRLLGIERNRPEETKTLLSDAEETAHKTPLDAEGKNAYRRVIMAAGDVLVWHGQRNDARDTYKRAEVLSGRHIPPQVRAARVGAYPNSIREHLARGNHGAALEIVNDWEETFPTDKVQGQTFFWRGKILTIRDQHQDAARYLARSIALAIGSAFETEARWLLADSLEKIGRTKESQVELAHLAATGFDDQFTRMAREKLKQIQAETKP